MWTKDAFEDLDNVYNAKSGFTLPRSIVANADITRVIKSAAVQAALNPAQSAKQRKAARKKVRSCV